MQLQSRSWFLFVFLSFVLLAAGSYAAGIVAARSNSVVTPAPTPGTKQLEPGIMAGFPDAATLQSRALAGELDVPPRVLSRAELDRLQAALDRLNLFWHATTVRLHKRMSDVVDALIESGDLEPGTSASSSSGELIGARFTVKDGVSYVKEFHPGDDAEVDSLHLRFMVLKQSAERVIRAAFQ